MELYGIKEMRVLKNGIDLGTWKNPNFWENDSEKLGVVGGGDRLWTWQRWF
jgi:hypothetical protein